jgi:hypothetical protein
MSDPRDAAGADNIPANPYPVDAPLLEERPGYPFARQWFRADLTDEAQLGNAAKPPVAPPCDPEEPVFVLYASDKLSGMLTRCWANMAAELGLAGTEDIAHARRVALAMDEWRRKKNSAGG